MKNKLLIVLFFACTQLIGQQRARLPSPINTPKSIEYAPSITADGRTMIYQSDQYGLYVNGNKKVPDISADGKGNSILDEFETNFFGVYEVKLHASGEWLAPQNIEPINKFANENLTPIMGGPSISYDGNELYFFANFGKNGYGREDIYSSERTKNGWSKPKNIGSSINSDGYEGFPSISPDGKKLYFTREILGKKVENNQCYRIMVAEKNRLGNWKNPYELPTPVNFDCEKAPRILADGKTLVFSSIKKEGRGDFDFYKTVYQENGSWSDPVNLEFVNTKKSDLFVSVSPCGDMMYYVSDGDIFTTTIPESLRPIRSATIQGFVKDSVSGNPIEAKIIVKNKESQETIAVLNNNRSDGRFTAIVPFGQSYTLSINLPTYFTNSTVIEDEQLINCDPIPLDFKLQKIPTDAAEIVKFNRKVEIIEENIASNDSNILSGNNDAAEANSSRQVVTNTPKFPDILADKTIEEMELIADSPETSTERIEAQGAKLKGKQIITRYALILRIIDKQSSAYINKPVFELLKEKFKYELEAEQNGNDYVFKVLKDDTFSLKISAENYLDFSANIPAMSSDRRVTVKMAQKLASSIKISLLGNDDSKPLNGSISIYSTKHQDSSKHVIQNGFLSLPLIENDNWVVSGSANKHLALNKEVKIELPTNGNKIIELELKLALNEYKIEMTANDLETGYPIPNAVFYVYDDKEKRVLELLANRSGKAEGVLPKNGKYSVEFMADGFKTTEQFLPNLLQTTQILFKPIADKIKTHEMKVLVYDRFTEEELYPITVVNNTSKGQAPFFIEGSADAIFDIALAGDNIKPESHQIIYDESNLLRLNMSVLAQKRYYPFYFRMINKKNNRVIARATFKVVDIEAKKEIQEIDGPNYLANLDPTKNYIISINQEGFEPYTERGNALDLIKSLEFERDIYLKEIEVKKIDLASEANISENSSPEVIQSRTFGEIKKGKKITLESIYFDQSSPVLRTESHQQLDELTIVLQENPNVKIEIRGHTDNAGDFYLNVKLSKERCESVIKYLKDKGIKGNRLESVGRGSVEPITPNTNEENRKKNRRVEFMVL
ncbi:MAG: outer membrane protein OmpA-like peptidoglycan-associated protein [Arcticibacterium sp.]|jgi:outer membrane protein OmpA-like peptidoglycan-associated protein